MAYTCRQILEALWIIIFTVACLYFRITFFAPSPEQKFDVPAFIFALGITLLMVRQRNYPSLSTELHRVIYFVCEMLVVKLLSDIVMRAFWYQTLMLFRSAELFYNKILDQFKWKLLPTEVFFYADYIRDKIYIALCYSYAILQFGCMVFLTSVVDIWDANLNENGDGDLEPIAASEHQLETTSDFEPDWELESLPSSESQDSIAVWKPMMSEESDEQDYGPRKQRCGRRSRTPARLRYKTVYCASTRTRLTSVEEVGRRKK